MTLASPRQKTIKRLFAVSGNQCYFPNCKNPLVDKESGKVTGKICHIKGRKPGAARYDPDQADEERHGFDNLVLMCSIHHDVIDDDPVLYTVFRLEEMKVEHEKIHTGGKEPSDEIVNQFILNLNEGFVIHSKDQKGGQIAHSIININYQETEREEGRPELQYFSMESSGFQPELPKEIVNCKIKFYRDVKQFGFGRGTGVFAMWDSMTVKKFIYEIYNLGKIPFFPVTIGIISESTILIEEKVNGSKVELNSIYKGDFDEYDLLNKIEKENLKFPLKIRFFCVIDTGKRLYSDEIELTGNNIKNKIEIVDYDILDNHIDKLRGAIFSVNDPFLRRVRIELVKISRNKMIDENRIPTIQKAVELTIEGINRKDEKTNKIETFLDILHLLTFTAESLVIIEELCLESLETLYNEGNRNYDLLRILYAIGYFGDLESTIMRAIDDKVPRFLTNLKDQFCIFIYDEEKKELLKNNRVNTINKLYDKKKELRPEIDELDKKIDDIINELIYKYENLH